MHERKKHYLTRLPDDHYTRETSSSNKLFEVFTRGTEKRERGYYTVARRYEFYLRVVKIIFYE